MITYISIDSFKQKLENRFFSLFFLLMTFLFFLFFFMVFYCLKKEVLLTKSIEVTSLEAGYYQIHVDNVELAKLMNQVVLMDKKKEFSYHILNVVFDEEKEKPQQVTFTTEKKLGNSIDMVLVRKKLFTVLLESIKGG